MNTMIVPKRLTPRQDTQKKNPQLLRFDSAGVALYLPVGRSGVEFKNVDLCYSIANNSGGVHEREVLPPVVKNFTARAHPNEHIGIIGRTGSGKSSLILSLIGLLPCSKGGIFIDGIILGNLPKPLIHKIVGVFPQMSLILQGWTLRDFMDPTNEYSDDSIKDALIKCGLLQLVESLSDDLDTVLIPDPTLSWRECSAGNQTNFKPSSRRPLSDYQLRYVSLARLVLNASQYRIILVDEPPPEDIVRDSPVNPPCSGSSSPASSLIGSSRSSASARITYFPINELLKEYFSHCTVFIVAHHATSLQHCDRVWLLHKGELVGECVPADIKKSGYASLINGRKMWRGEAVAVDFCRRHGRRNFFCGFITF